MKRFAYIVCLLLCMSRLFAAETIIIGEVYNASTGEPVPAANIVLRGTKVGASTNEEGLFMIRTDLTEKRTLVVSAIGYKKQRFEIMPGMQAGIDVALQEKVEGLREIQVLPDDNEAIGIIDLVRKNREVNDRQFGGQNADNYEEYKQLYLSDIRAKHLDRFLWKSLKEGMISREDSSLFLPLYISAGTTQLSNGFLSQLAQKQTRCVFTETDYEAILSLTNSYADFYRNNVSMCGTAFVSPLAKSATVYYDYFLADSITTAADSLINKRYLLHYRTKNGYYPTFIGEMEVDSGTWALRRIEARVPREVNLNYLHALHIEQIFDEQNILQSERLTMALDFAIKADSSHVFPSMVIERNLSYVSTDATAAPSINHVADSASLEAMTKIEDVPIVKIIKWGLSIATTGYIPIGGPIDIGKATDIFHYNKQHGLYFALPLHTNEKLWKNVSLDAYFGYGWGDKAFKGMGQVAILMPTERRHWMQLRYEDNYVYSETSVFDKLPRENGFGTNEMDLTTGLFDGLPFTNPTAKHTAIRERAFLVGYESDWQDGVETTLRLKVGRLDPSYVNPHDLQKNVFIPEAPYPFTPFRFQSLTGIVRLSWHERAVDFYMRRIHLYGQQPTVFLGAEIGSYSYVEGGNNYRMYAKLHATVRQQVSFSVGGKLTYVASAGIVIGKVPYPLLEIMDGNQSYLYDSYRFTLMNSHQYATDRFLTLHAEWNGMGVLFNLIPGVRFLHLRELVEFKLAYGGLSNGHFFTSGLQTLNVPYVEAGVGIGNILRLIDVYAIWRLTHRNDPTTPLWGIRGRIQLGM